MKIAVCIKQVPDTEARLRLNKQGTWIEEEDLPFVINESDECALEEALQIREKSGGEVVVFSLGPERVREVSVLLGVEMLAFAEPDLLEAAARRRLEDAISSGKAARVFERLIEAQGGDPKVVENPSRLPQPRHRIDAKAPRAGFVTAIATEKMGFLSIDIGCGRRRREDTIDPAAGFLVEKNVGDRVENGETLAVLCLGDHPAPRHGIERELAELFTIGDERVEPAPLAVERL